MLKVQTGYRVLGEDMVEDVEAFGIVGVHVAVTAEVNWDTTMVLSEGGEDRVHGYEGKKELRLAAAGREVKANVEGGRKARDGKEDGEDCRRGGWQHCDL